MATAALSVMLRRPVKFVADRMESFLTDIHAREHTATVRLACTKAGDIIGFDLDDLTGIGPYSVYPRTSGIEGNQVVNLTGGPYRLALPRQARCRFTNKNVTCVPCGRPSHCDGADRRHRRRGGSRAGHGPGAVPSAQPDRR
jgi:carbon-monoxide dehydrogenase large subunit